MHQSRNTLRQAVIKLLEEIGPMHYRNLAEEILSKGLAVSSSKKPEMTLNSTLSADITRNGSKSEFIRLSPGVYGLRALHAAGPESESKVLGVSPNHGRGGKNGVSDNSRQVRIPFFPVYDEVRHLLKIWPGCIKAHVTGLHSTLAQLRGTPQNPVTWTDPDTWIPEKLSDDMGIHDLAMAIWVESNKGVNPRYIYGHWLLVQKYDLLSIDSDGKLRLTDQGRDFIEHQGGRTEIFLDQQEGLAELLAMISGSGPVRFGDLFDEWSEYLEQYSKFRTDSTIRDTLRRRLKNLLGAPGQLAKCSGWKSRNMKLKPSTYFHEPCVYSREGIREASAVVRMARAIEHRNDYHLGRRDCRGGRRQHVCHRSGERTYRPTVSKNSWTYVRISSGPGRSPSCPAVEQDRLEKAEDAII